MFIFQVSPHADHRLTHVLRLLYDYSCPVIIRVPPQHQITLSHVLVRGGNDTWRHLRILYRM